MRNSPPAPLPRRWTVRKRHDLSYDGLVDYVARRLTEHGEADAAFCVARLERNLGLDQTKLLRSAQQRAAQREARP